MWKLSPSIDVEKRLKKHRKKHSRELKNVFDNLDTFFKCLEAGASSAQIHRGFIHPEPSGVLAIDQKGKGAHLKEFRLYIYQDEESEILHLIILGDKNTQADDIKFCKRFVEALRAEKSLEEPADAGGRERVIDLTTTESRDEFESADESDEISELQDPPGS